MLLLAASSCCIFRGNCALKRNQQKETVAVDSIFSKIQEQYYEAVKALNDRFVGLTLQNCTVSLSNVYSRTVGGGLKFFVLGASYQNQTKSSSTVAFTLSPPPPPPSGEAKAFVNPNDESSPFTDGTLADIIYKGAMAFHGTPNFGLLSSHSITIDNSFTADNQGNLSISVPIGSFTPNASGTLDFQYGNEIKFQFTVCDMCDRGPLALVDHGGMGCTLLSSAEFQALEDKRPTIKTKAFVGPMPAAFTLKTPPVGDQGKQNSCVGWAVGYTYLSTILNKDPNVQWNGENEQSPSFIYNQVQQGKCTPIRIQDALDLISIQGDVSLKSMEYDADQCSKQPDDNQIKQASGVAPKVGKWYTVNPNNVDIIKSIVYSGAPVIVGFSVTRTFEQMWAKDGMWTTNCTCGQSLGGHCVCIVGYDDTKKLFKIQNQWGAKQGDNGFFWVTYELVKKGCFSEAYAFQPR
jgi:Papain family cysteine protease